MIDRAGRPNEMGPRAENLDRRKVRRGGLGPLGSHLQLTLGEGAALHGSRGEPPSDANGRVFEAAVKEN